MLFIIVVVINVNVVFNYKLICNIRIYFRRTYECQREACPVSFISDIFVSNTRNCAHVWRSECRTKSQQNDR
jgi:hypothetical protein